MRGRRTVFLIHFCIHLLQVFPTEIRTLGSGICVAVATVANAINSKVIISYYYDYISIHRYVHISFTYH